MNPMNTLSRPRYFICKMSILSLISLALLVTSISPVMANTASFTRKETASINKGKSIATECLKPKTSLKTSTKSLGKSSPNTLNTLFTCSAFTETINTAQQNKVAAFPLVIPAALTVKEAALLAVSAAVTACKINKDCSKNATQILNELLSLGSTLFKFSGTKLADFKQHVNDLWNKSKDSGIILPQFLQVKKLTAEERKRKVAEELARKNKVEEAQRIDQQKAQNERKNLINTAKELLKKLKDTREQISKRKDTIFKNASQELYIQIKRLERFLETVSIPKNSPAKKIRDNNTKVIDEVIAPASKTLGDAQKLLNK